jgi:hypothetical protein
MCRCKATAIAALILGGFVHGAAWAPARAEVLITEQEAMRPPAAAKAEEAPRGIFRAPKIFVLSPDPTVIVTSPMNLKLKFESFGGTKIDQDSIKVIYLKNPAVDLTTRLKKHLKGNAIEMDVAEAPPGEHHLKVEVKDSDGHLGTADVVLKVAK